MCMIDFSVIDLYLICLIYNSSNLTKNCIYIQVRVLFSNKITKSDESVSPTTLLETPILLILIFLSIL